MKSPLGTDGKHPRLSLNTTPCPNVLLSSNFPPQAANAGCQDRLYLICNQASTAVSPLLLCSSQKNGKIILPLSPSPGLLIPHGTKAAQHQAALPQHPGRGNAQGKSCRIWFGGGCGYHPALPLSWLGWREPFQKPFYPLSFQSSASSRAQCSAPR